MLQADQEKFTGGAYYTSSKTNPPFSATKCALMDDGNCSPTILRSTLYNIPTTDELLSGSQVRSARK